MRCENKTKMLWKAIAMVLAFSMSFPAFSFAEETNTEVHLIKDDVKYCTDVNRDGKVAASPLLEEGTEYVMYMFSFHREQI